MNISTKIYAADVMKLKNEKLYQAAYQKVTDERRKKTDRMHFPEDRQLSLGVELLLLEGLKQLGVNLEEIGYRYGANGKPYLTGVGQNVHFSLSHSGRLALCAISSQEIGCDVEKISDVNLNIAKRFFFPTEYDMIEGQKSTELRREMFFRLWTLKESYIKMTGMGMSLPMDSFCIHFDQSGISINQKSNYEVCYFQEFELWQNYRCSVCGLDPKLGEKNNVTFEMLDLSDICSFSPHPRR